MKKIWQLEAEIERLIIAEGEIMLVVEQQTREIHRLRIAPLRQQADRLALEVEHLNKDLIDISALYDETYQTNVELSQKLLGLEAEIDLLQASHKTMTVDCQSQGCREKLNHELMDKMQEALQPLADEDCESYCGASADDGHDCAPKKARDLLDA